MDSSKKVETGASTSQSNADVPEDVAPAAAPARARTLSGQDARKILEALSKEQLVDVLQTIVVRDDAVLDAVRSVTGSDVTFRKLFIRSVGSETTSEKLRSLFSSFGELEDAVVVTDKETGKSKGYGFVTFKHIDGAALAMREPNKKIDGRMTVVQLAAVRTCDSLDVWTRKVFIRNVPFEISPERLLDYFSAYGDIEEGPLGFDQESGKEFAFLIYKSEEGARKCLENPMKNVDGHQLVCKLANDGKNVMVGGFHGPIGIHGDAVTMRGLMNMHYGGSLLFSGFPYGSYSQFHQNPRLSSYMPLSYDGIGYTAVGYPDVGVAHSELNSYGVPRFAVYPGVGDYGMSSPFQAPLPPTGFGDHIGGSFNNGPPSY